jgi:hypothetical protein
MDLTYQVVDPNGKTVLQAEESCRYPKEIELGLLKHGYTIRLNGKKITKREAENAGKTVR